MRYGHGCHDRVLIFVILICVFLAGCGGGGRGPIIASAPGQSDIQTGGQPTGLPGDQSFDEYDPLAPPVGERPDDLPPLQALMAAEPPELDFDAPSRTGLSTTTDSYSDASSSYKDLYPAGLAFDGDHISWWIGATNTDT